MSNRRRRYERLWGAGFTACIGLSSFFSAFGSPGFETIRGLDVMRLMLAGAGVAVTIMLLIMFIKGEPMSEDNEVGAKPVERSN